MASLPQNIEDTLQQTCTDIGLNPSETLIFLYLLQNHAPMRVSDIARKTRTNRTTLYGILKALSERGLVSSTKEHGRLVYRTISPHLLIEHIERAKEKLSTDAEHIREALPVIEKLHTSGSQSYPSVHFFEGIDGIKHAYDDTIKNNKSKMMCGFMGTDAAFSLMDSNWIRSFINRRVKAGVPASVIVPHSEAAENYKRRESYQLRNTKLLPPGFNFNNETIIYDDKVLITSFSKNHPLAVLIEDVEISRMMKELFRYIDGTLEG